MTAPTAQRGALGIPESAAYLGISERHMYRLSAECGTSGLPVVYIGRRRVFKRSDLDAFLERNTIRGGRG